MPNLYHMPDSRNSRTRLEATTQPPEIACQKHNSGMILVHEHLPNWNSHDWHLLKKILQVLPYHKYEWKTFSQMKKAPG